MPRSAITIAILATVAVLWGDVTLAMASDAEVDRAVARGLEWLAAHQSRSGHWTADHDKYPTSMTALAGIALLCDGSTTIAGQVCPQHPQGGGLSCRPQPQQRLDRRSDSRRPLHLRPRFCHVVSFASARRRGRRGTPGTTHRRAEPGGGLHRPAQTSSGGWGYVSAKDGNDFDEGSTTITQVQGLRGCRNAGIAVPREIVDKAINYIKKCTGPDGGVQLQPGGAGGGGRPAITAAALACLFNAGDYDSQYVPKLLKYSEKNLDNIANQGFGHWHYAHYYYAQVLYREGGAKWEAYRNKMFPRILSEAASDGSWSQDHGRRGLHHRHQPYHPATSQRRAADLSTMTRHRCVTTHRRGNRACGTLPTRNERMNDRELNLHDGEAVEKLNTARQKIVEQLGQVIVGQSQVIEELLISLFSRGHCLLEGVPGLAKTLMINTLSRSLNLTFSRIQFTPDLMPADITGTDVIEENRAHGHARLPLSRRAAV